MRFRSGRSATLALVSWMVVSCTIQMGSKSEEAGGAATSMDEPPSDDPCVVADSLPRADQDAAAEAAEAKVVSEGKTLADAWSDPAIFRLLHEAAYEAVGCDLNALSPRVPGQQRQELHSDDGPDYYCGPGHGSDRLLVPAVSDCLNMACREHDACYAQCSQPTSSVCMWGDPTSACDDPFMNAMIACRDDSHQFGSALVRHLATSLYASGVTSLGCPNAMKCPGDGPCRLDAQSTDCAFCLEKRDVGGVCQERACADEPDDVTCYAANCPEVGGCYGGYNVPRMPTDELPAVIEPGSMWSLSVLRAVIPGLKPSGESWDADAGGFASPDVTISVRVGSSDAPLHETTQVEDSLLPTWADAPPLLVASAAELQTFLRFVAIDADLAFDDSIGTCDVEVVSDDFSGSAIKAVCADQGQTSFTVFFALTPAP